MIVMSSLREDFGGVFFPFLLKQLFYERMRREYEEAGLGARLVRQFF